METYHHLCDDYYVNLSVNTSLTLPAHRETLLHFFERIQRSFPSMKNFYARDRSEIVLEEDKVDSAYRWVTLEPRRLAAGHVNPETVESALQLHRLILEIAPYHLSLSALDCEAIDLLFGFDFVYQGNHNQLVADALGVPAAFERALDIPSAQVVHYEPSITLSFDQDCRLQCRINVETRTNDYHVRTKEYPEEQVSVYVTCRYYGCLPGSNGFVETLDLLARTGMAVVDEYVISSILQPLAKAITLR